MASSSDQPAGDGPQRSEIESTIARNQLQDRIEMRGWADAAGVREAIASASILALPSVAEGLPVVIMEALALGRPVVSTYVAGIPELVEPGITGWLVPAGNTGRLVAALRDAVRTPTPRLREMGEAGRMAVLARHVSTVEASHLARLFHGEAT
jgi:glycosyltransferase involved in cell wall biosynthesis